MLITLTNMFSLSRNRDLEMQLEFINIIQILVRMGTRSNNAQALDLAEKFGQDYIALEHKIKTYDYTKEDEFKERWLNYYEN